MFSTLIPGSTTVHKEESRDKGGWGSHTHCHKLYSLTFIFLSVFLNCEIHFLEHDQGLIFYMYLLYPLFVDMKCLYLRFSSNLNKKNQLSVGQESYLLKCTTAGVGTPGLPSGFLKLNRQLLFIIINIKFQIFRVEPKKGVI